MKRLTERKAEKRLAAWLLVFVMIFSLLGENLSVAAWAQGTGTYAIGYRSDGDVKNLPEGSGGHKAGDVITVASSSDARPLERDGYQFGGWTVATASDARYQPGDHYEVNEKDADGSGKIWFSALWCEIPRFTVSLQPESYQEGLWTDTEVFFEMDCVIEDETVADWVEYYCYRDSEANRDLSLEELEALPGDSWESVEPGSGAAEGNYKYYFKAVSEQHGTTLEYINTDGLHVSYVQPDYHTVELSAVNEKDEEYLTGDWAADSVTVTIDGGIVKDFRESFEYQRTDPDADEPDTENGSWIKINDTDSESRGKLKAAEAGEYRYWFRAKSVFGKYTEPISLEVRIDRTEPTVSVQFEDKIAVSNTAAYESTAGKSGIEKAVLLLDGTETAVSSNESGDFTITVNGTYQVAVTNGAGTTVVSEEFTVQNIDKTVPELEVNMGTYQPGTWTDKTVTISLENTNKEQKGTSKFYYSTSPQGERFLCGNIGDDKAELVLGEEEKAQINLTYYLWIESENGLFCGVKPYTIMIDKIQPQITAWGNTAIITCLDQQVTLNKNCGVSGYHVEVWKDGKLLTTLDQPASSVYMVTENGRYNFVIVNGVGVRGESAIEFKNIDKINPSIFLNSNGYEFGRWTSKDVKITLKNLKPNLGINVYRYREGLNGIWNRCDNTEDNGAEILVNHDEDEDYVIQILSEAQYNEKDKINIDELTGQMVNRKIRVDKEQPSVTLDYQNTIAQSQNISYTVEAGISGIRDVTLEKIVDGKIERIKLHTYEGEGHRKIQDVYRDIRENGTYRFSVTNGAGVTVSQTAVITNIDRKDPILTLNSNGYREGSWVNQDIRFSIGNGQKNLGETSYWVKLEQENDWRLIGKSSTGVDFKVSRNINAVYQFKAVSQAGRTGEVRSFRVRLDKVVPAISASGDTVTYSREQTINVKASSGISGISRVEVRKNGGGYRDITSSWSRGYEITENGSYQFRIANGLEVPTVVESNVITYANIDREHPVMRLSRNGYRSGKWTAKDVTITLENTNKKNLGDSRYFYRVSGDRSGWIESSGPDIIFNDDTETTYEFKVQSAAGTDSSVSSVRILVDVTAPDNLMISFGDEGLRELKGTAKINKVFKESVKVTLYAQDDTSGIKFFTYGIKDGRKTAIRKVYAKNDSGGYSAEFYIEPQYIGSISVVAYDELNHHYPDVGRKEDMKFIVDGALPTAPVLNLNGYKSDTWTNQSILIGISGSEALSGVKRYEYTTTAGDLPNSDSIWTELAADETVKADKLQPDHVKSAHMNLESDTSAVFYFRAVNNADVPGEMASCAVRLQKTPPPNAAVTCPPIGEGEWYKAAPNIVLNVPAPTPAPVDVYYKLWSITRGETEESAAQVRFQGSNPPVLTGDGEYRLKIWSADQAGNRSPLEQDIMRELRLDGTLPKISVNYSNNQSRNGNYFNKERTAVITVDELNFDPSKVSVSIENAGKNGFRAPTVSGWSSRGSVHTATVAFSEEAEYRLTVDCTDLAGNRAIRPDVQEFVIDITEPEVQITNVKDLTANREPVAPSIIFSDENPDFHNTIFTLTGNRTGERRLKGTPVYQDGTYVYRMEPINTDDNYVLNADIYDMAGNRKQSAVSFSVNQYGATFVFEQKEVEQAYTNQPFKPSIQIWDVDEVTIVSMTVNGRETDYTFRDGVLTLNDEINKDGKYVLALDVTDAAGNAVSMNPVQFFYDATKPVNHITGVEAGSYYFEPVTVTVRQENPLDTVSEVRLNGTVLAESEYTVDEENTVTLNISEYRSHVLEVVSVDEAGNMSETPPLHFTLSDNVFTKIYYMGKESVKSFFDGIFD